MAFSISAIASSISLPMVGCLALACRCDQRASFGTQNTFSARYSSGSSAAAGSSASKRSALRLEGVRDVLEEDQAERDVLVVGRLQVLAQLVGGKKHLGLEAEICPATLFPSISFLFFKPPPAYQETRKLTPLCCLINSK